MEPGVYQQVLSVTDVCLSCDVKSLSSIFSDVCEVIIFIGEFLFCSVTYLSFRSNSTGFCAVFVRVYTTWVKLENCGPNAVRQVFFFLWPTGA